MPSGRWAGWSRDGTSPGVVVALLLVTLGGCSLDNLSSPIRSTNEVADDGSWVVLDLQNVLLRQAQSGATFYRALTGTPSFEIGVLRRQPGDLDPPIGHPNSTMYRFLNGSGAVVTAADSVPFEPGHVFFIREGIEHRIARGTSIVDVLVVFSLGSAAPTDPELSAFAAEELVAARDDEQNVFTDLLDASGMRLGMYMIPKNGGDPFVREHPYDELKIVIEGGARFDIGDGGLEAEPGTIAYITSGTPHQFRRTSDALDVLVVGAN